AGDAGMVELLGAVAVARPRRAVSRERHRRRPFPGLVLADDAGGGGDHRLLRRPLRLPDAAPQGRLSGDRHLGLWRDRADRRAQHAERDQWRDGIERRHGAATLWLELWRRRDALLLRRPGPCRAFDPDLAAPQI